MHVNLYFNICIAIFTSGYALLTTHFSPVIYALCLLSIVGMLIEVYVRKVLITKVDFFFISFLVIFVVGTSSISTLLNLSPVNILSFFKFILVILFSYVFCFTYNVKEAVNAFLNVFLFVSILSLIMYIMVNVFNVDLYLFKIENVNGVSYHIGLLYVYLDGFLQFRNVGVFWEPGIYASFITLALCLELFFHDNRRKKRIYILLTTLLTTFSSAAAVFLIVYLFLVVVVQGDIKFNAKKFVVFLIGMFGFCLICYLLYLSAGNLGVDPFRVFDKLLNPEDTEGDRFASPINSLKVFSESPVFGWGLSDGLAQYLSVSTISLTATSFYYLAVFGVFGFFYSVMLIFGISMLRGVSLTSKITIASLVFIILNKEPHVYFTISYIFLFYIATSSKKVKVKI
jgi:hypothetical protein